jgi:hypothetical protein
MPPWLTLRRVQRHVSAVLYLNNAGEAFGVYARIRPAPVLARKRSLVLVACAFCCAGGGDFCCEPAGGGPVATLAPRAGTLLLYPSSLWHAVSPVAWGARHTLAVWLTRDAPHAEDAALLGPGACVMGVLRCGSAHHANQS